MPLRVFATQLLRENLSDKELSDLVEDFKAYKSGEGHPNTFGRDAPYDDRTTYLPVKQEEVQHIHLIESSGWPIHTLQFNRTSDTHLVYCQGFWDPSCYLLIQILSPDAHNKARDNNIMRKIGKIASKFRKKQ